jgi:hypothetical protein
METEHREYQWSKGNKNTENQWSKGNRKQRLSMVKWKENKKTINDLIIVVFCFLLIIDSLCFLFPFDHWFSVFSFLLIIDSLRKQNKKTINDQKETEQKDYQWSKGNIAKRLSMIKRKENKKTINDDHWYSLFSVSIWLLIVFLFCFLLIIDYLFVLFPFDHW